VLSDRVMPRKIKPVVHALGPVYGNDFRKTARLRNPEVAD
jgi:hypothetical protein